MKNKEQQAAAIASVLVMAESSLCQGSKERMQDLCAEMAKNKGIGMDIIEQYCRLNSKGSAKL